MQRLHQIAFALALVLGSWYGMLAVHELGHVAGAVATGGQVTRVVLHPLAISRTDVSPNPHPGVVIWAGPIIGGLLPWCAYLVVPRRWRVARQSAGVFAGFCLLANGAYIGGGAWDGIGDCREMLQTGTPIWCMLGFGIVFCTWGLLLLHRLGSFQDYFENPQLITARWSLGLWAALTLYLSVAAAISPAM